ncbi:MAG: hypothetical protein ACFFG0_18965 [Candidatus Thorarchaeota archaeon]
MKHFIQHGWIGLALFLIGIIWANGLAIDLSFFKLTAVISVFASIASQVLFFTFKPDSPKAEVFKGLKIISGLGVFGLAVTTIGSILSIHSFWSIFSFLLTALGATVTADGLLQQLVIVEKDENYRSPINKLIGKIFK